jgi:hypothetical protein
MTFEPGRLDLNDPYGGSDHVIGGEWDHHVSFVYPDHTLGDPKTARVPVWAHLPDDPIREGQCLIHKYSHHWVQFEVETVKECPDQRNIFFAVLVVQRIWLMDGELAWHRVNGKPVLQRLVKWVTAHG